jgi:hypothetical protein
MLCTLNIGVTKNTYNIEMHHTRKPNKTHQKLLNNRE